MHSGIIFISKNENLIEYIVTFSHKEVHVQLMMNYRTNLTHLVLKIHFIKCLQLRASVQIISMICKKKCNKMKWTSLGSSVRERQKDCEVLCSLKFRLECR